MAVLWIGVGLSSVVFMECLRMSAVYVYISSVTVYGSNCNGNEKNMKTYMAFVDQEKAYDDASREKLWKVLDRYGIK